MGLTLRRRGTNSLHMPPVSTPACGISGPASTLASSRPRASAVRAVRDSFWFLGSHSALADAFEGCALTAAPGLGAPFALVFPRGTERPMNALARAVEALGVAPGLEAELMLRRMGDELRHAGAGEHDLAAVSPALQTAVHGCFTGSWSRSLAYAWADVAAWLGANLEEGCRPTSGG